MEKIVVLLHGPAERPDGSQGYPRVDGEGRIHLCMFEPTYHGYFGALPHEMVHSFRIHRTPQHDWFFEEGYAELVALRAWKSPRSFPWYETPLEIAAGQWLARGEGIPLSLLRKNSSARRRATPSDPPFLSTSARRTATRPRWKSAGTVTSRRSGT